MSPIKIIVTGGAGFIGSHLVEQLLHDNRILSVRVIDNLSNGYYSNISHLKEHPKFEFFEKDICDYEKMVELTKGYDVISHQAALGSVPRSIENPMLSTKVNIDGTVNILHAAVVNKIDRVILACSSSTYGDHPALPKSEDTIGKPLSPYAVTKYTIELFADVFRRTYGLNYIGLRYFNIFGPKQNPDNPYAAVIPIFCKAFLEGKSPVVNGDGSNSRDFTYIENALQANLKAIFTQESRALNTVYNVACGEQSSLNEMIDALKEISGKEIDATYGAERAGDVRHSKADISKIQDLLQYEASIKFKEGLRSTYEWYKSNYEN
ncbi:SDR family oxidoreductase [Fulvivirga sp. M361]|uniref:SDR family oxidoreductase n=1 Tax=Fulvivirga sp. M361 TaxID=2594266 RepID=UPI0011798FDD|nr:SDR family oxidoreductase [Fulvivirga sp. M361]TRX50962.1 SDR family oxidoreductase [Fulvivirga sp. M361]